MIKLKKQSDFLDRGRLESLSIFNEVDKRIQNKILTSSLCERDMKDARGMYV